MDAAMLQTTRGMQPLATLAGDGESRVIGAAQFRGLLVSHRRMVRVDQTNDRLRGLRDLDTGEIFLTDERRLLDARH
jgi:hypothetical protein